MDIIKKKNIIIVVIIFLYSIVNINNFLVYNKQKSNILMNIEKEKQANAILSISNQFKNIFLRANNVIEKENEYKFFDIKEDDKDIDKKILSLNTLKNSMGDYYTINNLSENKKKLLKDMFNIVHRNYIRKWKKSSDNKEYREELRERLKYIRFLGDSQVASMGAYNLHLVRNDTFHTFRGTNIRDQLELVDETTFSDIRTIIFFNGMNIRPFESGDEYIKCYYDLINKGKSFNKNLKFYITSLCPGSKDAVAEDLKRPIPFNYHNAPMLDKAIKEEFTHNENATYIETKWIIDDILYSQDGVHFKPEFYMTYIPYVLDFIDFVEDKN